MLYLNDEGLIVTDGTNTGVTFSKLINTLRALQYLS